MTHNYDGMTKKTCVIDNAGIYVHAHNYTHAHTYTQACMHTHARVVTLALLTPSCGAPNVDINKVSMYRLTNQYKI